MTEDRLAELMVKKVDGLATAKEEEELMRYVSDHPELQQELGAHGALKAVTDEWVGRLAVDGLEDAWSASTATRLERGAAVALIVGGVVLLTSFGVWELWLDPLAPLWVKLGTSMVLGGMTIVLGSVMRWKWRTSGSDRYSEVER